VLVQDKDEFVRLFMEKVTLKEFFKKMPPYKLYNKVFDTVFLNNLQSGPIQSKPLLNICQHVISIPVGEAGFSLNLSAKKHHSFTAANTVAFLKKEKRLQAWAPTAGH